MSTVPRARTLRPQLVLGMRSTSCSGLGRVGGLATFAPMCGSFNWLCAAQAKRAADNGWLGEAAHPFVAQGNAAAMATAFLARVAVLRGVQASVENPPRSYMWNMFLHHRVLLDLPHSCRTLRCGFRASGSTEDEITKEYKFACTHPWIVSLARGCICPPSVAHITMTKKKRWKVLGHPDCAETLPGTSTPSRCGSRGRLGPSGRTP